VVSERLETSTDKLASSAVVFVIPSARVKSGIQDPNLFRLPLWLFVEMPNEHRKCCGLRVSGRHEIYTQQEFGKAEFAGLNLP
jgi:hypothetical protein